MCFMYIYTHFIFRLPAALDREAIGMYFQTAELADALSGSGYNAERLAVPYIPQVTGMHACAHTHTSLLSLVSDWLCSFIVHSLKLYKCVFIFSKNSSETYSDCIR